MDASIEIDGLRKPFGSTQALDGMTFTVRPGQLTGFVGPNGASKRGINTPESDVHAERRFRARCLWSSCRGPATLMPDARDATDWLPIPSVLPGRRSSHPPVVRAKASRASAG